MNINKAVVFVKAAYRLLEPGQKDECLTVRIEYEDDQVVEVTVRDYNDEVPFRGEGESINLAMAQLVSGLRAELTRHYGDAMKLIDDAGDILSEPD